jgi:hypothetical protein
MAVTAGTGLAGRQTVRALRQAGYDAVVLACAVRVGLASRDGLAAALVGVDAVIDVTNTRPSALSGRGRSATPTGELAAGEHHAGVNQHVVLSIVGVDRVEGNAHYAGRRAQGAGGAGRLDPGDHRPSGSVSWPPRTPGLVDVARGTLTARGESLRLIPGWHGLFGVEMAGEVLLPGQVRSSRRPHSNHGHSGLGAPSALPGSDAAEVRAEV